MAASYPTSAKSFSTKATNDSVEASHVNDLQDEVTAIESALLNGVAHDLKPSTTGTRDLGTSSLLFRTAYLDTALILGAASTAGVRLDLDTGVLEVREGDDSAYADLKALTLEATSNATVGGTLAVTGVSTFTGDVKTTAWTDYSGTSTVTGWSSLTTTKIFYKKVGKFVFVAFQLEGTSNATSASFTLPVARSTDAGFGLYFAMGGDIQDNGAAVTVMSYGSLPSASSTVTLTKSNGAWTGSGTKRVAGSFCYEAAS